MTGRVKRVSMNLVLTFGVPLSHSRESASWLVTNIMQCCRALGSLPSVVSARKKIPSTLSSCVRCHRASEECFAVSNSECRQRQVLLPTVVCAGESAPSTHSS